MGCCLTSSMRFNSTEAVSGSVHFGQRDLDPPLFSLTPHFLFFSNLEYLFLKRSTLPAESTNFCFPVKKGWH